MTVEYCSPYIRGLGHGNDGLAYSGILLHCHFPHASCDLGDVLLEHVASTGGRLGPTIVVGEVEGGRVCAVRVELVVVLHENLLFLIVY